MLMKHFERIRFVEKALKQSKVFFSTRSKSYHRKRVRKHPESPKIRCARAIFSLQSIYKPKSVRKATRVGVFIFILSGTHVQHPKVYVPRVFRYVLIWHQWCDQSKAWCGLHNEYLTLSPRCHLPVGHTTHEQCRPKWSLRIVSISRAVSLRICT
jgi:hypothetical protein